MQIGRVTRVSNPRSRNTRRRKRKMNPRKMSLKQKAIFGSARVRAAAKAALSRKRSNPRRRTVNAHRRRHVAASRRRNIRRATNRRKVARRRASNPAYMITLPGVVNPAPRRGNSKRRKRNTMAAKKNVRRRRRASANPRRRRRNSVRVIVRRRNRRRRHAVAANPRRRRRLYRANPRRRRHHHRHNTRSRNPQLFGRSVGAFEMAKAIVGGLAGVAITKAVPNMLPSSITSGSQFMNVGVSLIVAVGAGMLAKTLIKGDSTIGDAILFGGLMQAGSVAINTFLPSATPYLGLSGLGNGIGDLVAGRFPVPQNPIMAGMPVALPPAPVAAPGGHAAAAGVGAIYNPYGRAM